MPKRRISKVSDRLLVLVLTFILIFSSVASVCYAEDAGFDTCDASGAISDGITDEENTENPPDGFSCEESSTPESEFAAEFAERIIKCRVINTPYANVSDGSDNDKETADTVFEIKGYMPDGNAEVKYGEEGEYDVTYGMDVSECENLKFFMSDTYTADLIKENKEFEIRIDNMEDPAEVTVEGYMLSFEIPSHDFSFTVTSLTENDDKEPADEPASDEETTENDENKETASSPVSHAAKKKGFDNYVPVTLDRSDPAITYNIVINYIFGDNSIAHDPYIAVVEAGEDFSDTVTIPVLPGYEAYYNDVPATTVNLNYTDVHENHTVFVQYRPTMVNYQVRHFWQNADNDGYTLHETETLTGYTGDTAEAEAKAYEGFAVLSYVEPAIAADGSTIVEIRYDREYSLIRFNLNGGYGVDPIYQKWGSSISVGTPQKTGFTFAGWDKPIPQTMPYGGDTFTATWTPIGSPYTVIYWAENAEDSNFSYWGSEVRYAETGASVSGTDTIPQSISGGEDEHFTFNEELSDKNVTVLGDGTSIVNVYYNRKTYTITLIDQNGNDYICGFKNHTHTYNSSETEYFGGCYGAGSTTPICGQEEHDHTRACYTTNTRTASNNAARSLNRNYTQTNGMVGTYGFQKFVYVDGTWYYYSGSHAAGSVTQPEYCTGHMHTYEYTDTLYYGGCYPAEGGTHPICGLEEHTHTSDCRGTLIHRITAKYGANIIDEWFFTGEDGVNYPTTNPVSTWFPVQSSIYTERLSQIATMPGEHSIFRLYNSTNSTKTYYYCVEALPGQTPDRTYNGTDYIYLRTSVIDFNYYTQAEDFYEIEGFTRQYARTENGADMGTRYSLSSGGKYYLYYLRDRSHGITYQSNGTALTEDAEGNSLTTSTYTGIPYELPMTDYDIVPPYPDNFPIGAYTFGGWYDNAEFAGNPYPFSTATFGTSNLILFAKWIPTTYTVEIYQDLAKARAGTDPLDSFQASYGEIPSAPDEPTPENEEYVFMGWFYYDEEHNREVPWVFGASTVQSDVKIYAKWSSSSIRPYNVYFRDEYGNDLAPAIHSSGYAGSTRTFDASADVPEGYFPRVKSHSIVIDINGTNSNGINDYTFIYENAHTIPYTVHYVDARTGEQLLPDKVVYDNTSVKVTEKFKVITGYVPDAFQKYLTVAVGQNNEITFYYTKDSVHAFYLTSHYIEKADGTWDLYNALETWATIGDSVTARPLTIDGYTLNTDLPGTVQQGTVSAAGLELSLYYERNSYPYRVRYIDQRTGLPLHEDKTGMGKVDAVVTETAEVISGYDCINGPTQNMTIQIEYDPTTPARNIITFYYQVQQAEFTYIPVGHGTVDNAHEYVAARLGTAAGSTATPDTGYLFDGWYLDENCTQEVTDEATVNGTNLVPNKVEGRYVTTTFYAKFVADSFTVNVRKTATDDSSVILNATYAVYPVDPAGSSTLTVNGTSYTVGSPTTIQTSSSSTMTVSPGKQYILVETAAPQYYDAWTGKVLMTVNADQSISFVYEINQTMATYNAATQTLILKDEPCVPVPSGVETGMAEMCYLLLLGAGIMLFKISRKTNTPL